MTNDNAIDLSDVEEVLALQVQLEVEGLSPEEVDDFFQGCREFDFEVQTQKLRDAGVSEEEIEAFWQEIKPNFIDDNEDHAVDDEGNII